MEAEGAMGAEQPPGIPEVPPAAGAQTQGGEPSGARAHARERRAFAETISDQHAGEIYRYVLAWTADSAVARELTFQVLRTAVARMEQLAEPGTDLEARLVAIARAAVARRDEAGSRQRDLAARQVGAFAPSEPVPLLLAALARLDDAKREVLILRQLLGYTAEHAARLLAFHAPTVEELERGACAILWRRINHAPDTQKVSTWDQLTVAAALRQGAPSWLPPLDGEATAELRRRLLDDLDPDRRAAAAVPAGEGAGSRWPQGLLAAAGRSRWVLAAAMRRRWLLAGCVASAVIGTVAALTLGGAGGQPACAGTSTCLVSTTAGAVADTALTQPSTPSAQPGLPTTSSRAGIGLGMPAITGGRTPTTNRLATTTTVGTTASTPRTSRPRFPTTTTSPGQTTSSTSSPTTLPTTVTTPTTTIP
jgi:DNA-directed RNA polymerase specialized sigma24 family protein